MALKKANKTSKTTNTDSKRAELKNKIASTQSEIERLLEEKKVLEKELLELNIAPFKIGGYALVKVPCGKSTKEQKCLLECVDGFLYARPIKENGELSGRHFSLIYQDYSKYLKEVE